MAIHRKNSTLKNQPCNLQSNSMTEETLINQQTRKYDVWILFPIRYTHQGTAPTAIHFKHEPNEDQSPTENETLVNLMSRSNGSYEHKFEAKDVLHHHQFGKIYKFHTTLDKKELSTSFISILDEGGTVRRISPSPQERFIKLVRHDMNWKEQLEKREVLTAQIGKHHNVFIRKDSAAKDPAQPSLIEDDSCTAEDWALAQEALDGAFEEAKEQQWTICYVFIFSDKCVKMSSINELFGFQMSKDPGMDLIAGLDFSPFRYSLDKNSSTDQLVKSLEKVRGQFVNKLIRCASLAKKTPVDGQSRSSQKSKVLLKIARRQQELMLIFDLMLLHISNIQAQDDEYYFMVYDADKETLQFAVTDCMDELAVRAADLIYTKEYLVDTGNRVIQEAVRHNWIKYQCLYGQEDEYNIFRSLCFAPALGLDQRYHIGFVALTLQILLCTGIIVDSLDKWSNTSFEAIIDLIISLEYQFEEILIVTISALTFTFILQRLMKTIESFQAFYTNMNEVCIIPKHIIALDFTSNIIVGSAMAIATPFFLLQSEDIQSVVLNSFALTFFIELDDMANIFESDEQYLLKEDANTFKLTLDEAMEDNGNDLNQVLKRKVGRQWYRRRLLRMTGKFVFSPFYVVYKIISSLMSLCRCCRSKRTGLTRIQAKEFK